MKKLLLALGFIVIFAVPSHAMYLYEFVYHDVDDTSQQLDSASFSFTSPEILINNLYTIEVSDLLNYSLVLENGSDYSNAIDSVGISTYEGVTGSVVGMSLDPPIDMPNLEQVTNISWGFPYQQFLYVGTYHPSDFDEQSGNYIYYNNTSLRISEAPVPEPATIILFGIGLLGLAGVNRRKK